MPVLYCRGIYIVWELTEAWYLYTSRGVYLPDNCKLVEHCVPKGVCFVREVIEHRYSSASFVF